MRTPWRHVWRLVGYTVLFVAVAVAGYGWIRLLLSIDTIMRHERVLAMHAGGLVNHEQRIREMEQFMGAPPVPGLPPNPRATLHDIMCGVAARSPLYEVKR